MLCKGKCGKKATHGNWCCKSYYKCLGYRKQLSDRAKARGNNGAQGRLSKGCKLPPNLKARGPKINNCLKCNNEITSEKYCDNTCKTEHFYDKLIDDWLNGKITGTKKSGYEGFVKVWLKRTYGEKCSCCGWNERNPYSGNIPIEIDHIDGNAYNNYPDNVRLICPNCHSLTKNYRGANKGNGKRSYLKKYYMRDDKGKIISG